MPQMNTGDAPVADAAVCVIGLAVAKAAIMASVRRMAWSRW